SRKLVHKLFTRMAHTTTATYVSHATCASLRHLQARRRPLFAAPQIGPTRVFQRSSFEKVRSRRATDRICPGSGNHAADNIAPAREELQNRARRFSKKHRHTHIGSKRGDKLGRTPQAALAAAYVHDSC